jgi:ATP-dependent DNA helicase RecQ
MSELDAGLARLGYEAFLSGQREAIETLLDVGRLLLVAPTGGGKSLTYQLPAVLLPGTTLVISPLVALMHDQVAALEARGVAATYLAATLPSEELHRRMDRLAQGELSIVYAAPERLAFPGFRALLDQVECPLVAVDEAHCISEWGHDFRPEYLQIGEFVAGLEKARVLACTATATPVVRDEILERLDLPVDTPQIVHGFARPNLSLRAAEVRSGRDREARIDAALDEALGRPGSGRGAAIVYTGTRRAAETEAARLAAAGYAARPYHAGMDATDRSAVQDSFIDGTLEVIAATNAFGMGIDRADVRAVVHLAPPGSIEAYYQEVGRAGRDGAPALGLLLVSAGDLGLRRSLIERDGASPEMRRHKWSLFLELMRLAEGGSCRHDAVLRYFGDEQETLGGCGVCDVCRSLGGEEADPETTALVVRKALSAIARIHGRFGLGLAAKLLRGTEDERLERSGLDRTPTFGALAERTDDWLARLLRRCVTAGWVDFEGGDRPVVLLTDSGHAVMRGDRAARLILPAERAASASPRRAGARRPEPIDDMDQAASERFQALRHHRLEVARAQGVPPYVVASDRTLRELATFRPSTPDELLGIHGIGAAKARKYGAGFLEILGGS